MFRDDQPFLFKKVMGRISKLVIAIVVGLLVVMGICDFMPCVNTTVQADASTNIALSKSKTTVYVGNLVSLKLNGAAANSVKW